MPALDALDGALGFAGDCIDGGENRPLDYVQWTPPQDDFLRLNPPSGAKLFRSGNQAIGKSTALLAEVIHRATGTHPHYRTKRPPVDLWVVCTSWSQSVAIQCKFWDLAPKDELTKRTRDRFSIEDGWGRGNPVASFLNGSIVRFRTTGQGAKAQAGATPDYIAIDEPTTETMFRELRKRVTRSGGQVGMALTPVNFDCSYLKEQVAAGMIDEVHTPLVASALIPIGSTTPLETVDARTQRLVPMDQAWIDELRRITPAQWIPVVIDGGWDSAPEGVWFTCFDRALHSFPAALSPDAGDVAWCLGIDYAAADRELGYCAVLCQVQPYRDSDGRLQESIMVTDEVAMVGTTASWDFAVAMLAMLDRNGVKWTQLRHIYGDNPVQSRFALKSNMNLMKHIAKQRKVPYDAMKPRILSAKEGTVASRSLHEGCQYIYERIASRNLIVHPRCEALIKGLETWDYTKDHAMKDILDALRYSLKTYVFARPSGRTVLRVA